MGALMIVDRETGANQSQYLTFTLGREIFAVGILCVKEIIEYGQLTIVPMMPASMRGVINLRGSVVPVVDLACRFGRPPTAISRRSCIVIVEVETDEERQVVGVIVDGVNEVLEIAPDRIEPPPAFGARLRTDFISGMARVDGGFIILLAVGRVLSFTELAQFAESQPEPVLA